MAEPLVVKLTKEFRQRLLARDAVLMREMTDQWLAVEAALEADFVDLAQEVADMEGGGESVGPGKLADLRRYQRLLAQVGGQLERFNVTAESRIDQEAMAATMQGLEDSMSLIQAAQQDSLMGGEVPIVFDRLGIEAAENVMALARAGKPLGEILERDYPLAVEGITNRLIEGVARGINPRAVARNMLREGLAQGLNHILLVARDQQIRAYRESSRQQYEKSGVVSGYRRIAAKNRRTCMACLACLALDGKVYETSELMELHPQDRCGMIPIVEGFEPVTWESGEDWFGRQSPERQRDMMGPGRFAAWKAGKFGFGQLATVKQNRTWGPGAQVTPLKDLLKGKGGVDPGSGSGSAGFTKRVFEN